MSFLFFIFPSQQPNSFFVPSFLSFLHSLPPCPSFSDSFPYLLMLIYSAAPLCLPFTVSVLWGGGGGSAARRGGQTPSTPTWLWGEVGVMGRFPQSWNHTLQRKTDPKCPLWL